MDNNYTEITIELDSKTINYFLELEDKNEIDHKLLISAYLETYAQNNQKE